MTPYKSTGSPIEQVAIGPWQVRVWLKSQAPVGTLYTAEQNHDSTIVSASELGGSAPPDGDGIMSQVGDPLVGVRTADCLPLAIIAGDTAAVLHISRKTLVAGIMGSLQAIIAPEEITDVVIGPHICQEHFSFEWAGEDVVAFQESFPAAVEERNDTLLLSLEGAVSFVLAEWGIEPNRRGFGSCTLESADLPSYKRDVVNEKETLKDHIIMTLSS